VRDEVVPGNDMPSLPSLADLEFDRYIQFNYSLAGEIFADMPAPVASIHLPDAGNAERSFAASQGVTISDPPATHRRTESAEAPRAALRPSHNPIDSQRTPHSRLTVNSIDEKRGTNAQYFGLSGESDPYLLQHYRYDERGEFTQFKLSYRKVADDSSSAKWLSSPPPNGVPVYFKISPDDLEGDMKEETAIRPDVSAEMTRKELYDLVPIEDGCRLMDL
jgi:hypothetical protein